MAHFPSSHIDTPIIYFSEIFVNHFPVDVIASFCYQTVEIFIDLEPGLYVLMCCEWNKFYTPTIFFLFFFFFLLGYGWMSFFMNLLLVWHCLRNCLALILCTSCIQSPEWGSIIFHVIHLLASGYILTRDINFWDQTF